MEYYFIIALVVLFGLAILDLTVGVANDAVNFLNSAWGSRVAKFKTIMIVASLGILFGALFSSGMMEVARKGVFYPQAFSFENMMILFLAVMFTDVILLDFFNTYGLPTSTTVSIVFSLLGSAFTIAILEVLGNGGAMTEINNYINTGRALGIISAIFVSIIIAFVFGYFIQWISRLIFSFNIHKMNILGTSLFGGVSISIISYFIFFKGLDSLTFINPEHIAWVKGHVLEAMAFVLGGSTLLLLLIQAIVKINVFKIIVLFGTFALAMSFAGNDLVNFIGVPLAGLSSFEFYQASGVPADQFMMTGLQGKVAVPVYMLVFAGLVMILTLWINKKLRTVIHTTVNLSRQNEEGTEDFQVNPFARVLVGFFMNVQKVMSFVQIPALRQWIEKRFDNSKVDKSPDAPAFDVVRASINLLVASSLIAFGTSLKLPLSTTYVAFMVAMGSSLADRAWGSDSAVYRVSGVITVVGGWFLTALIAFLMAAIVALLLYYTGIIGVLLLVGLIIISFIRTRIIHKRRSDAQNSNAIVLSNDESGEALQTEFALMENFIRSIPDHFEKMIIALQLQDVKKMKKLKKQLKEMDDRTNALKAQISLLILSDSFSKNDKEDNILRTIDLIREIIVSLDFVVNPAIEHLANHHKPMSDFQLRNLETANDLLRQVSFRFSFGTAVDPEWSKSVHSFDLEIVKVRNKSLEEHKNEKKVGKKATLLFYNILSEYSNIRKFMEELAKCTIKK